MQIASRHTQKSNAPTGLPAHAGPDNEIVTSTPRHWIGWAALVVGIGAVVASITLTATPAGQGLTLGLAAFIAFFALLSLRALNQTPTHWGLFVTGFVLFLLPGSAQASPLTQERRGPHGWSDSSPWHSAPSDG